MTDPHHTFHRREDAPLLRGEARFHDDLRPAGTTFAAFLRAPHAFARIRAIDLAVARACPGVVAILTEPDIRAAGVGNLTRAMPMTDRQGRPMVIPHRPVLAGDLVRHVGQPVALVVAETPEQAQDAAEAIAIDWEPLPAVTDLAAAGAPTAPQIWPEAPGNLALDWAGPLADHAARSAAVARILATAPHVARVSLVNQRIAVASLEPRGATAQFDRASGRWTLRSCSQGPMPLRDQIAGVMGIEPARLRVLTDAVGGAFGMKTPAYPEYPALLVAARLTGRPVHWMATRSEAFMSDNQARDTLMDAALALDADGRFLALQVEAAAALGGYLSSHGAHIACNNFARCFPTVYDIPEVAVAVRCYYTNTVPTGPYRGAGRPEANYLMERLVDAAARVTGIERVDLRRRNLIAAARMPHRTVVGTVYDGGDFAAVLDKALALADWDGFPARRARSDAQGRRRGIGLCCFLEHAGGLTKEGAAVAVGADGSVTVDLGTQPSGQGQATIFARIVAARLGLDPARVSVRQGDSDRGVTSYGAVASRTTIMAGGAVVQAADAVIAQGRAIAADRLEAAEADIGYRDGTFEVVGTDRRLSLGDAAAAAPAPLAANLVAETPQTFPNGCHVAEVEVDPETGAVALVAYAAVDDCGVVLEHVIVEGQVQGGVAQGLGQALMEHVVYEPAGGQLLAGSFMDYAMPRAADLPRVTAGSHDVPATTNPLGVKGVGEAGTTASLAAIMNALADALPGPAGAALQMPATPERVWRACRALPS